MTVAALLALAGGIVASACDKVPLLAPSGSTISISATASTLPLNGSTQVVAFVLESAGTPPQNGTVVTFQTTLGRVEPAQVKTNGGRAEATFYSGTTSGTAIITAASGGAKPADSSSSSGSGTANHVSIKIGAAAVSQVAVSASPTTVPASGGTSTISASVTDENGNALGGVPVTFSTDAGSLSQSSVTTDASGRAQTTLTTSQTSKVTARAGATGTSGAPSGDVTVNVNTTPAITVGAPSPASPVEDQSVTFTLTRGTGGAAIQKTLVSWGDGQSQTYSGFPSSISHVYTEPGGYGVLVSATDAFGDVSNGTASVTVTAKPALTVAVSVSGTQTVNQTLTFTITTTIPSGSGISVSSVTIDFGDGDSQTAGNITSAQHVYTSMGTKTVRVTATASNGETSTSAITIVIS